MSRPQFVAVLVLLVLALSWQVCCGCSMEEGCLQYSDLLPGPRYETVRGDMISSTVTQYPDIVIDNSSSEHLVHEEHSLISIRGSGVVEGSRWWSMSLGVREYEEQDHASSARTTIPPYTSWIIRQSVIRVDREATIKGYYLFYCREHGEIWQHHFFECPAYVRETWTGTTHESKCLPR